MKFASVRELKNNTSELLRRAHRGESVLITSHGKPVAALQGISEENLEDFILSNHPELRAGIEAAYTEYRKRGGIPVEKVISRLKKKSGTRPR